MKKTILNFLSHVYSSKNKFEGKDLSRANIAAYNAARGKPNSTHICHAPFTNMYFNVHGDCAPCWLTFIEPDSYLQKSIHDIWFGEKYTSLRNHLLKYDLTYRCQVCLKNLQGGNYTSVLARAYDINEPGEYPRMMELELSNTCNLECVMCIGELSSSIRKNRERLPTMKNAYDDNFIEQLEEFIPHLKELRFNGGEPFLINAVFKIFEKVEKLNPKLKITIATNGTVLNYKVKEWLNKLNIHINFSLDSLTPEIYETIRVNAHFDRVMEHFLFYRQYTKENKRTLCLMVNPMRNNWHEMPEFIRFVNKHNCNIWFNTIQRPKEWSIWALEYGKLSHVYQTLSGVKFSPEERRNTLAAYNIGLYSNLVNVQINNWVQEAKAKEQREQLLSQDEIKQDAKNVFEKRMRDYVRKNFNEGQEQMDYRLKNILAKIELLASKLKQNFENVELYELIKDVPADVILNMIESRSVDNLIEEYKEKYSTKPIPQIDH